MPGVRAGPRSILWGCKLSVIGGTAADGNTALTAAGMLMVEYEKIYYKTRTEATQLDYNNARTKEKTARSCDFFIDE